MLNTKQELFKWRLRAKPAFLFASAYGMIAASLQSEGSWPRSEIILEKEHGFWWSSWAEILQGSEKSPIYQPGFAERYAQAAARLQKACERVEEWHLTELSDEQFNHFWHQFFTEYTHFWSVAVAAEVAAYGGYYWLEKQLQVAGKPASWASTLIQGGISLPVEEERALLNIALGKRTGQLDAEEVAERLRLHTKQYRSMFNSYEHVTRLRKGYFAQRVYEREHLDDIRERLTSSESYIFEQKKARLRFLGQHNFSDAIVTQADKVEEALRWQEQNHRQHLKALEYVARLYHMAADRYGIPLHLMLNLTWPELSDLADYPEWFRAELPRRQHFLRLALSENQWIMSSERVLQRLAQLAKAQVHMGPVSVVLHGTVAAKGVGYGPVRIVRDKGDIPGSPGGYIMVTAGSPVEYQAAFKRVLAVVTDEGGISSRAGQTARALGKPCLVGTKIGTHVLQDGDLVEVNAQEGTVSRIL